ncbi:MAG: M16 family metallopeptidase, partial [Myxococcaceae bacterium]
LADLADQVGNPRFLQRWAMASVTFGDDHPYGHLASGVPSTIEPLSLADVKGFYAKNAGPSGACLVITGKATLAEATAWAERYFGKWSSKAPVPAAPPLAAPAPRTEVVLVPKAGLSQTVIAAGRPAIRSGDPGYGALVLANLVFGGNFISRLNMNLREDKAYTYGTYSAVQTLRSGGLLVAGGAVRADVTGPSMTEVMKELQGLKSRPITPAEMEAAREGFVLSLPGEFETTERVANAATAIYWHDEPLDHFERQIAEVRGADLAKVQAAAEKFFDPALMKFVLVGDPEVVTKQVAPLGLGNIVQRAPPQPPQSPAAPVAKAKK